MSTMEDFYAYIQGNYMAHSYNYPDHFIANTPNLECPPKSSLRHWLSLKKVSFQDNTSGPFRWWNELSLWIKVAIVFSITLPLLALGLSLSLPFITGMATVFGVMGLVAVTIFHYREQKYSQDHQRKQILWQELLHMNHTYLDQVDEEQKHYEQAYEENTQTIDTLQQSLTEALRQKDRAKEQLDELTKKYELLALLKEGLATENPTLRTLTQEQRDQMNRQHDLIINYEAEITLLNEELKKMKEREQHLLERNEQFSHEARSLYRQRRHLVSLLKANKTQLYNLNEEKEHLTQVCTALLATQQELKLAITQLTSDNNVLKQRLRALNLKHLVQHQLLEASQCVFNEATDELARAQHTNLWLTLHLKELVQQKKHLQEQIDQLNKVSASFTLSQAALNRTIVTLNATIKRHESDLTGQLEQLQKEVMDHKAAQILLDTTLKELEQVKRELNDNVALANHNQAKLLELNSTFSALISADETRRKEAFKRMMQLLEVEESLYEDFALKIDGVTGRLKDTALEFATLLAQHSKAQEKAGNTLACMEDFIHDMEGRKDWPGFFKAKSKPVLAAGPSLPLAL